MNGGFYYVAKRFSLILSEYLQINFGEKQTDSRPIFRCS